MSDKDNAENYTERALKIVSAAFSFVITIFRVAVIFQCNFQRQIDLIKVQNSAIVALPGAFTT